MKICANYLGKFAPLFGLVLLVGCAAPAPKPVDKVVVLQSQPQPVEVAAQPEENPDSREERARYNSALEAMRQNRLAEAEVELSLFAKRFPDLLGPRFNLAIIYHKTNRPTEALALIETLAALPNAAPEVFNLLGILLREQGKFRLSRDAYLKALELKPDFARAHLNLAIVLDLYLQDLDQALLYYQSYQALQTNPDRRVKGWMLDLKRRRAKSGGDQ